MDNVTYEVKLIVVKNTNILSSANCSLSNEQKQPDYSKPFCRRLGAGDDVGFLVFFPMKFLVALVFLDTHSSRTSGHTHISSVCTQSCKYICTCLRTYGGRSKSKVTSGLLKRYSWPCDYTRKLNKPTVESYLVCIMYVL